MNIYLDINHFKSSHKTAVTVGTFDGLHLGHQWIFNELKAKAKELGLRTVLVTFSPHPAEVLKTKEVQLISSLQEKIDVFKSLKIDYMVVIPFSMEVANTEYDDFVEKYLLDKLNMQHLVFGHDHAFGKARKGTFARLQNLGKERTFTVSQVTPFELDGQPVSSSLIRKEILAGHLENANHYLGHPFSLFGKVVEGDKRGRELGYRTANIESMQLLKLIPHVGVYFVKVRLEENNFYGMCNVGYNPTFDGQECRIEVHIFDFNQDIYEEEIGLYFLKKIRDEKKFIDKGALRSQLETDEQVCRTIIQTMSITGG